MKFQALQGFSNILSSWIHQSSIPVRVYCFPRETTRRRTLVSFAQTEAPWSAKKSFLYSVQFHISMFFLSRTTRRRIRVDFVQTATVPESRDIVLGSTFCACQSSGLPASRFTGGSRHCQTDIDSFYDQRHCSRKRNVVAHVNQVDFLLPVSLQDTERR